MIPPYNGILLLDNEKKNETLIHGTTWMNFENVRNIRNMLNIYKEKVVVAQSNCGIGWGGRIS